VSAARVGYDGEQEVPFDREQAAPGRQVDVFLLANRVDGAVAIAGIVGVVEEGIDGLVALEVDDAEKLAAPKLAAPTEPGGQHVVEDGALRVQRAFAQGHDATPAKALSVSTKPRSFSGHARRHGSSAAAGSPAASRSSAGLGA